MEYLLKYPEKIRFVLIRCWSLETSSIWSAANPARGQCGVTALVVQDYFGGDILNTPVEGLWHFYNRIAEIRFDFTATQFEHTLDYKEMISNREEAFRDTTDSQYIVLFNRFSGEMQNMISGI